MIKKRHLPIFVALALMLSHCSHRDFFADEPVAADTKRPASVAEGECKKRGLAWQWGGTPAQCSRRTFLGYCTLAQPPAGVRKLVEYLKNEVGQSACEEAALALQQTTSLYLSDFGINDLTPLQTFQQLKVLILNNNKISDLSPLAGMRQLQVLRLEGNGLKKLDPLGALRTLVVLRLDDNQIEDVSPLAPLASLAQLNLNNNKIRDISALQSLSNLRQLGLAGNLVESLNALGGLSKLNHLEVQDNPIMRPGFVRDAFNCPASIDVALVLKTVCRPKL